MIELIFTAECSQQHWPFRCWFCIDQWIWDIPRPGKAVRLPGKQRHYKWPNFTFPTGCWSIGRTIDITSTRYVPCSPPIFTRNEDLQHTGHTKLFSVFLWMWLFILKIIFVSYHSVNVVLYCFLSVLFNVCFSCGYIGWLKYIFFIYYMKNKAISIKICILLDQCNHISCMNFVKICSLVIE